MSTSHHPPSPTDRSGLPLPVETLAAPLDGASPCGPDLEYDPAFQALLAAAEGKPERQYGDTVYPAEPPDWPAVRAHALALAERTRDLRVLVWLLRGEARAGSFVGAVETLVLLQTVLERFWPHVHPLLDALDADDPTARLNALAPLHHEAGLADLRAAGLTRGRGALGVRALELVFGAATPWPGEALPDAAAVLQGLRDARASTPALAAAMRDGAVAAEGIARLLDARLGAGRSPELQPLRVLMRAIASAGERSATATDGPAPGVPLDGAPDPATAARGEIRSRADAIRALAHVCAWLEANEPTHPAPILIGRAQRLLAKKNFLDVIRDLVPDGVGQVEQLAGPAN